MNSEDLALFALVADASSMSAAALQSGQDASTLSRRIGQLEKSLGTRLFDRSGRGVALTRQGAALLAHARQVGALMAAARAAMQSGQDGGPERLHIAAQPTIAKMLFGPLFQAIRTRFPRTNVHFTEGLAHGILGGLQAGAIDSAVLYRPEAPGSLAYEPLLAERLYLVAPPASTVDAARFDRTGWAGIPLVLPSTHHGMRALVHALAARRGQLPEIALECDSSIAITLDLVRQGHGCTVLPLAAAEADIAAGRLRGFPLADPAAERWVSLVLGRTRLPAAELWVLNQLVREVCARLAGSPAWPGTRPAG